MIVSTRMSLDFTPVIDAEIFSLRPDYCAVSVVAAGLEIHDRHPVVDRYIEDPFAHEAPNPWSEEHLEAWRGAYRAFGAKPQRTPCSAEALLARLRKDGRLPAVNAVVDAYHAVSVRYAMPIGGENVAAYVGAPRLIRARGSEAFDTVQDGKPASEGVPAGEVVWADDHGVTCRRWNCRQGVRTRIDLHTRQAWFVLERLEPMPVSAAIEAAAMLTQLMRAMTPTATFATQVMDRTGTAKIT